MPEITDIWFRSKLPLREIARRLELQDISEDAENYWAWVIGTFGEVQLDITRTHTQPAAREDTRVFALDACFTESLIGDLVTRLRTFVPGPIRCGRWEYRQDNDFDLVTVREYSADP